MVFCFVHAVFVTWNLNNFFCWTECFCFVLTFSFSNELQNWRVCVTCSIIRGFFIFIYNYYCICLYVKKYIWYSVPHVDWVRVWCVCVCVFGLMCYFKLSLPFCRSKRTRIIFSFLLSLFFVDVAAAATGAAGVAPFSNHQRHIFFAWQIHLFPLPQWIMYGKGINRHRQMLRMDLWKTFTTGIISSNWRDEKWNVSRLCKKNSEICSGKINGLKKKFKSRWWLLFILPSTHCWRIIFSKDFDVLSDFQKIH